MLLMIGDIFPLPVWSFDTSTQLLYEGGYLTSVDRFNHTLTLTVDYFQEVSDNIFLEGNLVTRLTNKEYAQPFVFGPNELYLSGYNVIDNLDLRAGKIITSWGSADFFSPLDNFNPLPPEISLAKQQDKLGAPGINGTYYINDWTYLQGTLMPQLKPTPFPDQYLKDNYQQQYETIYQSQGLNINEVTLNYQSTENIVWGLRLMRSFDTFDAGISYYQGYFMDPFPANIATTPNTSETTLEITLGYPGKKVLGFELQGEFPGIEGATLRGDLAYIIPQQWSFQGEQLLDQPYFKTVIGADYTTESNIYLNGGFIYGLPFEQGPKDTSAYLFLNINQEIEDSKFKPIYVGVLSLNDMSMGNSIGVDYQINENMNASLSYVFLLGDKQSKLGILERSEGIYFSLEWFF